MNRPKKLRLLQWEPLPEYKKCGSSPRTKRDYGGALVINKGLTQETKDLIRQVKTLKVS
jgi:hypothetical protein